MKRTDLRSALQRSLLEAGQPYALEPERSLLDRLRLGRPAILEAGGHIAQGRAPGHQRFGLEEITRRPVQSLQRLAEDLQAAAGRLQQAGRNIEQR
jgi:hypothetical protein